MPAERPDTQGSPASNEAPASSDAPEGRVAKEGKRRSQPASDFFATWKNPPRVRPEELRSRVWAEEGPEAAAPENASAPPRPSGQEPPAVRAPSQPQLPTSPAPKREPVPETPAASPGAISELQARLEGVVGERIDEAIAAGGRTIAASLGPALSRLAASIEESVGTTVRSELAKFAAEHGRVVRELRGAIADVERALEELKPPEHASEPATAARLEEGFSELRQQVEELGSEVGRPLGELRDAVLATLAADDQLRGGLNALSERLAALEDRGVLAVEEPLRELRREVAHDLNTLAARVEAGMTQLAVNPTSVRDAMQEAVASAVEKLLAERLNFVREQLAEDVSSEIAIVASTARTAAQEARFARGQLAQAVKAMEGVVAPEDEAAE